MRQRIKLAVSSCLLGNKVRYDGGSKLDRSLRALGRSIEWVPMCPEIESGLPVPREPMHLVKKTGGVRLITIETGIDHTGKVTGYAKRMRKQFQEACISGFVFKARSPSCGVRDAKLVLPSGQLIGKGPGLFAAAIRAYFPSLPIEDEERLRNPDARQNFLERARLFRQWQEYLADNGTFEGLVEFHAAHRDRIGVHGKKYLKDLDVLASKAHTFTRVKLQARYIHVLMGCLALRKRR